MVDQFEELFTLTADEETRRRFLAVSPRSPATPTRLRAFSSRCAPTSSTTPRDPEFGELLRAGMVAVAAPSEDELAEAIERPATRRRSLRAGARPRSSPTSAISQALPLLQYALTELFANRAGDVLTLEGYLATGGVVGALGRRAEDLYARLGPRRGPPAARSPSPRERRPGFARHEAQGASQRAPPLELEPDALDEVLARYGEHRLLTFDREPLTRTPTVEVAHEAILSQWERLREWIEERREHLLPAPGSSRRSRRRRRARSGVPAARGPAGAARGLGGRDRPRSHSRRARAREARAAANEAARRRARRRRATLAGFALLAAAASVLAAFALVLRDRARDDARLATARQLAASAQANLAVDPERSILLAIEAAETTQRHDGTCSWRPNRPCTTARRVARAGAPSTASVARQDRARRLLRAGRARFVATDLTGETPSIRDARTGETLVPLVGHEDEVLDGGVQPEREARRDRRRRRHRTALERSDRPSPPAARTSRRRLRDAVQRGRHASRDARRRSRSARLGRPHRPTAPVFAGVHDRTDHASLGARGGVRRPRPHRGLAAGGRSLPVVAKVFDISSGKQVGVVRDPAAPGPWTSTSA